VASAFVVVDTDIFIWITRGQKRAKGYLELTRGKRMVLSFAAVAELWRGAYARGYNERSRERLRTDIRAAV
jgi:predicted nucleic acid-binding protein